MQAMQGIAEAGGRLPVRHACLPAGRQAGRQHDACAGRPNRPRITRDALDHLGANLYKLIRHAE